MSKENNVAPQHTPEPWRISSSETHSAKWLVVEVKDDSWDGGYREIAQVESYSLNTQSPPLWEDRPNAAEIKANARLIAAAPRLLEACQQQLSALNGKAYDFNKMLAAQRALEAAVASATETEVAA